MFAILAALLVLPSPYDQVELRPEHMQGWYRNGPSMEQLIQKNNVKTVIEVGSWLGLSTCHIAKTIPADGVVYAVDHWLGSQNEVEGSFAHPDPYGQFLSNVIHQNLTHKIIPIKMSSIQAAMTLNVNPDLIYIDASHDFVNVFVDLALWYPFVKDRGLICGDDYFWGKDPDFPVKRAVDTFARENGLIVHQDGWFWYLSRANGLIFPDGWEIDP